MTRKALAIALCVSIVLGAAASGGVAVWLLSKGPRSVGRKPAVEPEGMAALGARLFVTRGCVACHSVDGTPAQGATWLGLYGRTIPLQEGGTALVDEAFIRKSILDPGADIHAGFPSTMPPQNFQDHEVDAFVAYVKSLAEPPPAVAPGR